MTIFRLRGEVQRRAASLNRTEKTKGTSCASKSNTPSLQQKKEIVLGRIQALRVPASIFAGRGRSFHGCTHAHEWR